MKLSTLTAGLALVASTLVANSALAGSHPTATFDFANLKSSTSGFLPSETLNSGYFVCNGDLCSSNLSHNFGGDLKYTVAGLTATATAFYFKNNSWTAATVVQDAEPAYNKANMIGAGLGVYHVNNNTSDDNVTANERLVITFSQNVSLSSLAMRSDGHDTNWSNNATFLLNGQSTKLAGLINLTHPLWGNTFIFEFNNALNGKGDQFYLGGMTVSPVPEPESLSMLVLGLALLGWKRRRRAPAQFK